MTNQLHLIVINDDPLARGGAATLAIDSALGAAKAGWNVSFFSHKHKTPDPRLAKYGISLHEVEGHKVSGKSSSKAIISGIWNRAAKRKLSYLIAEHDMSRTIIHVHNWAHFLSPSIFDPLRPYQDRIVMSAHDYFLTCGNGGQFNYQTRTPCSLVGNSTECLTTRCDKRNPAHKLWRVFRHKARTKTLPAREFNGKVLLVHQEQKPFFERAGFDKDNIIEIRNPIIPLSRTRVKAERNNSILFIGRLDVEKGADIAAKSAELAGTKIVFAGEGPLNDKIQNEFKNAEVKGFCNRKRLQELIQDARLLIMPSWLETFGMAAVEAMWSGVPVLISQNALLSKDIVKSGGGAEIDPGDVGSISKTIQQLLKDDALIKRMSDNAFYKSADIANSPESWTRAHLDTYRNMLLGSKPNPTVKIQPIMYH